MKIGKLINIKCKCGFLLFRYFKAGKGKIIKCFVNSIHNDYVGLQNLPNYHKPRCPNCNKELGIIMMIRGDVALKLNQGTIQQCRI